MQSFKQPPAAWSGTMEARNHVRVALANVDEMLDDDDSLKDLTNGEITQLIQLEGALQDCLTKLEQIHNRLNEESST